MPTQEIALTTDQWSDLGAAPCYVRVRSGGPVLYVISSSKPTSLSADCDTLTQSGDVNIGLSGQNVYARNGDAGGLTARVVVIR